MTRNSLEAFKAETTALKVPANMVAAALEKMEKEIPLIEIKSQLPSRKGFLEATMYLKRAANSDHYYMNKYDLAYSNAKPLDEGKNYILISPPGADGTRTHKLIKSPIEAISEFKKRGGDTELAIGKSIKDYATMAIMKEGKLDYLNKDFEVTYKSEPIRNTVFINQGTGFNMKQSANMLQHGSAYRDDLVSRQGVKYEAWNTYRFDEPRDNYGNLKIKQYSEGYGFDLKKQLDNYMIKEMDKPETAQKLIEELKDGERPVVSVINGEAESMTLRVQAMPRFGNLNFYQLNGKPENREQFQKLTKEETLGKDNGLNKKQGQGKDKDAAKTQEMSL